MKPSARERITRIIERWLLVEPLLLAAWTSHRLIPDRRLQTIRVQRGRIEYNPYFIDQLNPQDLEATLRFEALRILLKHPYSRRQAHTTISYAASNITIQEYLQTELPFPRARDLFGDPAYDKQYLEFYYYQLLDQQLSDQGSSMGSGSGSLHGDLSQESVISGSAISGSTPEKSQHTPSNLSSSKIDLLQIYVDPAKSGIENADLWDQDELIVDRLDDLVRTAQENNSWGSIGGQLRERILANLRPRLDYRSVLRRFRTSILSQQRRLTRMKPNRRYGFAYMGSRREYTTRLLFAVDVSGSMNSEQIREGFSVINHFFTYGVPQIDVIQFDTEITAPAMSLRRAQREIDIRGRGGTSFIPVMDYLDQNPNYDGLIIFTDGYAPCPDPPRNRRTRILWLFVHEAHYQSCYSNLRSLGQGVYLKSKAQSPMGFSSRAIDS